MEVKDLIRTLQKYPEDMEVFMVDGGELKYCYVSDTSKEELEEWIDNFWDEDMLEGGDTRYLVIVGED